ncbi:MAG TPA: Si-specific NAD(P)(+) transhydrogenase [Dehalococcoidia bacterium]|nr:Si-specific NAD(P)(+) transhydrogenase [Dehalococcoidia bacterium]
MVASLNMVSGAQDGETATAGGGGHDFDLVVIGGGPAGEKGAAQAAYFGKRVAIVEARHVGGAVVHTGTLPSKTLRETAIYLSGMRARGLYGVDYSFGREITVEDLFFRQRLIERSYLSLVEDNIARHRISMIMGTASLMDAHRVRVQREDATDVELRGEHILIATGSRPARPADVPFDDEFVYDSDSVLGLSRMPSSLIIAGAGVIGSEYATLFAALGVVVTLLDGGDRLLPFLDDEIREILCAQMTEAGIDLRFGVRTNAISVDRAKGCVRVQTHDGATLEADALLYCVGRQGNTDGLGLERIGVAPDARGRITVDDDFRTAAPSVMAAGDVIGFPALASTSMEQARVAVCHAFGFEYKRQVSALIPYGLYTLPEVSMVGESEDSLRASGTSYLAGRVRYHTNARAQIVGDDTGLLKLLFAPDDRRLLGVHIIGERATELIHVGQMCMQFGGTIDAFIDNVFNFPTISEAYKYAAYDGLQAIERAAGHAREAPRTLPA